MMKTSFKKIVVTTLPWYFFPTYELNSIGNDLLYLGNVLGRLSLRVLAMSYVFLLHVVLKIRYP